jgi:uncharacterized protein YabE (DUF348 family)
VWTTLGIAAVGLAVLAVIGLLLLFSQQPGVPVTVLVGSQTYNTTTQAKTVRDLLAELNIPLSEGDLLSAPLDSAVTPQLVVQVNRAREVTVMVDGSPRVVHTALENPLDILKSAGLSVSAADRVTVNGTPAEASQLALWSIPANSIAIRHTVPLIVTDDGAQTTLQTTADTVGEALFDAGVTLYLADVVTPDGNTPVTPNLNVTIERAKPVTIAADGTTLDTRVGGKTVGEALAQAGIMLVGLDYTIPDLDTALLPGITIRVIRVREEVITEQKLLPFVITYQSDTTLELDQRKLVQAGKNGVQQTSTRVRYENGSEVHREVESSVVTQQPVSEEVAYGTNIVIRTVDTPNGPLQYWRKFSMYATSYHPKALGGSDITASGRKLTKGVVGIDPTIIPYGTQLYVPDYGVGVAADTGAPRNTHYWIDLGYDDDNYVGWHWKTDVYILTPVPEHINYLLPEN